MMAEVLNDDVVGLYKRLNRFIEELFKSQSANVTDMNVHDQNRLQSYLNSVTAYLDWIVSSDQPMDYPETHPKVTVLEEPPVVPDIENPIVVDLVKLFIRARDEMTNSQSARYSTGLIVHDEQRVRAVVQRAQDYLDNYIKAVVPIDQPESTPKQTDTGSGRTGIKGSGN
jgi:hypothetical protein